jgi:hypothetical protein
VSHPYTERYCHPSLWQTQLETDAAKFVFYFLYVFEFKEFGGKTNDARILRCAKRQIYTAVLWVMTPLSMVFNYDGFC